MKTQALAILIILGAIAFYLCTYVVKETDQVILTQFGKPVGEPVTEAGLHFRLPFIQEVNRIEKRFLPWDGPANEMSTKDKTYLIIDTYARWRISDAMQYFYACVTSVVPCPDWTIFSVVRPAMRWPSMN